MHISAPRDLETLVCARGAKLSLKSLSKRLESLRRGSRGLIYDLPATARPARIHGAAGFGGRSGANVISQAEKFAKLGSIALYRWRGGQFPARRCNSLLGLINSLFGAIKFPVPISRELSSNELILLRSDGRLFANGPIFTKFPVLFPDSRELPRPVRPGLARQPYTFLIWVYFQVPWSGGS